MFECSENIAFKGVWDKIRIVFLCIRDVLCGVEAWGRGIKSSDMCPSFCEILREIFEIPVVFVPE
jgi:hypothetical protein